MVFANRIDFFFDRMILQILQVTVLDIATHKIGNPVSLLTADLNEENSSVVSTTNVLQPKVNGKYYSFLKYGFSSADPKAKQCT